MSELSREDVLKAFNVTEDDLARVEQAFGQKWNADEQVDLLIAQSLQTAEEIEAIVAAYADTPSEES